MVVTREELEVELASLRLAVTDPLAGIHGPDSLGWRFGREAQNFLGAGRAALLQLAHPPVAHAIETHSRVLSDVRDRFQRTFDNVFGMTFGDLDRALNAARRVHNVHTRIRGVHRESLGRYPAGSTYAANEADSLAWVYITLVDSVIVVRDFVGRPLPAALAERYFRESLRFAKLFGIRRAELPVNARDLAGAVDRAVEDGTIAVGDAAKTIAGALLAAPRRELEPAAWAYRALTGALLPPSIAADFGLPTGRAANIAARLIARAIDRGLRALPKQLRYVPGYLGAEARCGRRSRFERRIDRAAERALFKLAG